jgi:hypothetical protein
VITAGAASTVDGSFNQGLMPGASGRGVLPLSRARCCHGAILVVRVERLKSSPLAGLPSEELFLEGIVVYAEVMATVVMV